MEISEKKLEELEMSGTKTLAEHAKDNCKGCLGQGYVGKNTKTGMLAICACVVNNMKKEKK